MDVEEKFRSYLREDETKLRERVIKLKRTTRIVQALSWVILCSAMIFIFGEQAAAGVTMAIWVAIYLSCELNKVEIRLLIVLEEIRKLDAEAKPQNGKDV